MRTSLKMEQGIFYDFSGGYLLPTQDVPQGAVLEKGTKLPVSSMFEIHLLLLNGTRVGFYFQSRFEVENHGGYLLTYMKGKGEATTVETPIKNEFLVLYNYPNRGSLAINPQVNPSIATIFEEQ